MNNVMKKYTTEELKVILGAHAQWVYDNTTGKRAYLSGANLYRANLKGAYLVAANLVGANLEGANLECANLYRANLVGANLSGANLEGANLKGSYLKGASLVGANLVGANLYRANLKGANLYRANLYSANLKGVDLEGAYLVGANLTVADLECANLEGANMEGVKVAVTVPEGNIEVWKKCRNNVIVRMSIPAEARRSCATRNKCRAEYADVLEVIGSDVGISQHDGRTEYRAGQRVTCDRWEEDRWQECAGGIHFFLTRKEAEAY